MNYFCLYRLEARSQYFLSVNNWKKRSTNTTKYLPPVSQLVNVGNLTLKATWSGKNLFLEWIFLFRFPFTGIGLF